MKFDQSWKENPGPAPTPLDLPVPSQQTLPLHPLPFERSRTYQRRERQTRKTLARRTGPVTRSASRAFCAQIVPYDADDDGAVEVAVNPRGAEDVALAVFDDDDDVINKLRPTEPPNDEDANLGDPWEHAGPLPNIPSEEAQTDDDDESRYPDIFLPLRLPPEGTPRDDGVVADEERRPS